MSHYGGYKVIIKKSGKQHLKLIVRMIINNGIYDHVFQAIALF